MKGPGSFSGRLAPSFARSLMRGAELWAKRAVAVLRKQKSRVAMTTDEIEAVLRDGPNAVLLDVVFQRSKLLGNVEQSRALARWAVWEKVKDLSGLQMGSLAAGVMGGQESASMKPYRNGEALCDGQTCVAWRAKHGAVRWFPKVAESLAEIVEEHRKDTRIGARKISRTSQQEPGTADGASRAGELGETRKEVARRRGGRKTAAGEQAPAEAAAARRDDKPSPQTVPMRGRSRAAQRRGANGAPAPRRGPASTAKSSPPGPERASSRPEPRPAAVQRREPPATIYVSSDDAGRVCVKIARKKALEFSLGRSEAARLISALKFFLRPTFGKAVSWQQLDLFGKEGA